MAVVKLFSNPERDRFVALVDGVEAAEGEFVLVHAGFAIQVVSEDYANEVWEELKDYIRENADFGLDGIDLEEV